MGLALKGRKSSSTTSRKATRHDDTLFGQDTVEVLLGVSEGPIYGLKEGATSFYVGDVPLLDRASQTPNISNFELRVYKGTNPADSIRLNLGGISSTKNVGLELRVANQSVVVQLDKTQIDYLDLRMVVQQLFAVSKEGGEFPIDVQFKVEVKPRSSATWQIPFNNEPPPTSETGSGASAFRPASSTAGMVVNDAYRETYIQDTAPVGAKARGAMWFNTATEFWRPSIWDGAAWAEPADLTAVARHGYYPVWGWLDFDGAQRQAWYSPAGTAPPPDTLARGDFLLTPQSGGQIYSYNDTAWVGFQDWAEPAPAAPGVLTINGLTRSTYPKEFRIPVARINEPYDVRVTRLSPVSTKEIFRNITFESVQEVNRDAVSFPDLAVAWLTIKATDTFTSIPEFTGIYRGLVIPVPSNYTFDEATQSGTYTGIWDGSFKMAYTSNPAWHAYNFIMNSRYGKNSYFPEVADKWDYYAFGRHCDAHQFRFNEYITEPRSLNELINYVVGIAGGRYVDRGDGYSTVIWDADDQPAVAIFAPENTAEGAFTYSFTDVTERKNDYRVSFKNPELNYREDRLRVFDQNSIDVHGRNAEEFVAVGCRDAAEAVKRGRLRLATALTEKIIVSFKTNRLGRYLLPFQVILVADDQSTNVITGRVKNPDPLPVGTTRLPLRDQIYLEAGISYSVQFTVADDNGGLKVVSYPLTVTTPGQQTQLVLSQALAQELPEYAVFSIGAPKAFRITGIEPDDEDPDFIDIVAIEVNRQKWAFVDGLVELRDILGVQTGPLSKFVYAPTNARITPEISTAGELSLVTTWNPTETKLNRGYRVYQSINGQPMQLVYEGDQLLHRQQRPVAGTYVHSIVAVGLDGTTESAPITVSYIVANAGSLRSVSMPTNLRLVDEPEAPIFRAIDPRFAWDPAADPLVTKYRVEVLNGANQVVHAETIENFLQFTYSLAANRADNGGTPLRQFTVQVRAIDMLGNLSQPVSLIVSHPAPVAPSFELSAVSEVVFVQTSETVGDWAGTLVWMEKVSGFNPVTTVPRADQRSTWFSLPAEVEQTYYVRVAAYDSYGKTGLNYSNEKLIKATIKLFDPEAPSIPGQPFLVENVTEISLDGVLSTRLTIGWPPVTSENLGYYEVFRAVGANPPEAQYVGGMTTDGTQMTFTGLMPGRDYSFAIRAQSKNGFAVSERSQVLVVTAALNTTAPSAPADFKVEPSFEAANLTWTNPPEKDLRGIEVWVGDTNLSGDYFTEVSAPGSYFRYQMNGATTKWFWLRPINTSGTPGGFVGPIQSTSPLIKAAQLAAGIAEETMVASGLLVNKIVASLPNTRVSEQVTLDGRVYKWDVPTGSYTPLIQATDIAGKVTAAQIDTVNKEAIAAALAQSAILTSQLEGNLAAIRIAGQLTGDQIENRALTAAKFAEGLDPIQSVDALPNLATWTGPAFVRLRSDGKLYRISNGVWTKNVDISDTVGTVPEDRLPNFDAAKLYGDLDQARIKALAAGKITGQLRNDQIEAIDGSKVAGALSASTIQALNDNRSIRGIVAEQIASVNASAVGYGLTSDQIVGLAAAKLAGQIVGTQITDGAITTGKLDAAAVTAGKIAAGAVLTSHLAIASANVAFNPDLSQGTKGWSAAGDMPGWEGPLVVPDFSPNGFKSVFVRSSTTAAAAAGTYVDLESCVLAPDGSTEYYPIKPGQVIEASACISAHRCTGRVIFQWFDINKTPLGYVDAGSRVVNDGSNGGSIRSFPKSSLIATSPNNARYLRVFFRMDSVVDSSPHLFVSAFMLATGNAGQTETSPYTAPGTTTIDGGTILTDTIGARQIIASSITTSELNVSQIFGDTAVINEITSRTITTANLTAKLVDAEFVSAKNIVAETITGREIHSDAITARHIKAGEIETSHMDAGSINASVLVGQSIKAGHIGAGEIVASKLGVVSANMAYNPDFSQGTRGWTLIGHIPGLSSPFTDTTWCPSGHKAIAFMSTADVNSAAGTYADIDTRPVNTSGGLYYYPVTGNQTYEYSICVSNHRCTARLFTQYFDASGAHIGYGGGASLLAPSSDAQPNGGTYAAFPKLRVIETAPANAVSVRPFVRMQDVSGNGPYLFLSAFMMAATRVGATETSPYVAPGTTVIDGSGIITNSLEAGTIKAGTITTRELNVTNIFADNAVITNISSRVLVANAIKGDMIEAQTIGGNKLTIASSNLAYNADFAQDGRGWTTYNNGGGNHGGPVYQGINTNWCPSGLRAYDTRSANTPTDPGGSYDIASQVAYPDGSQGNYPVTAGSRFEISCYVSAHRCDAYLVIGFFDAAGSYRWEYYGSRVASNGYSARQSLQDWNNSGRTKVFVTVPEEAAHMRVHVRVADFQNAGSPSYAFVSGLMIAPTFKASQAEFSAYVAPSMTTIDGGRLITDTVIARHIQAGSIETRHMTVDTIDAKVLKSRTITTGLLAAEAVEAINIKAESVTAGKLLISDMTNMLKNGYFTNGLWDGWTQNGDGTIDYADPATDPSGPYRIHSTSRHPAYSHWIDVTPGDWLYFSCQFYNTNGSGNAGIYVEYYTKSLTNGIGRYPCFTDAKHVWTRVEGRDQVPDGVQQVRVLPFHDGDARTWFTRFQVRRAASASLIVDGTIEGVKIKGDTIEGGHIKSDSIDTGHIRASAIGVDQLAAGAVRADKLAVGLSSGNLIWNADVALDGFYSGPAGGAPNPSCYRDTVWRISGTEASIALHASSVAADQYLYFDMLHPMADGSRSAHLRVQGGKLYEFSAYLSTHRCAGYLEAHWWNGSGYAGAGSSNRIDNVMGNGSPGDGWRAKMKMRAPDNATHVLLRVFLAPGFDNNEPYVFASGFYLGVVPDGTGANVYSDYVPQSSTVISGGAIATGTLDAKAITSKTITTDHIKTGSLDINDIAVDGTISAHKLAADVLVADRIRIWGDYTLAGWRSGTEINGGAVAANTITAQKLSIGMRPMTVAGLNFEMQVDGNGNKTGWLTWTGGYISIIGDGGENAGFSINAGSIYTNFQETHVWWSRGATWLDARVGGSDILNSERIPMAYWTGSTGLAVLKGGTQIDGDKITTRSIKAAKIGVAEIQTDHMGFNSISGDRIIAGSLSADKITSGTIAVNSNISIGSNGQTQLSHFPEGGCLQVRNRELNQHRLVAGYLGPWTGDPNDFGLLVWGADGANRVRFSNAANFLDGVVITDASIVNAKIQNLTIGNEKVASEAITRGAFASTGAGTLEVQTSLTVRNAGTRLVIWAFRTGDAGNRYLNGVNTGTLQVYIARPGQGWQLIREIPNSFCYEWVAAAGGNYVRHMPTTDCVQWTTLEGGWHQFLIRDTASSSASAVTATVVEFSK